MPSGWRTLIRLTVMVGMACQTLGADELKTLIQIKPAQEGDDNIAHHSWKQDRAESPQGRCLEASRRLGYFHHLGSFR